MNLFFLTLSLKNKGPFISAFLEKRSEFFFLLYQNDFQANLSVFPKNKENKALLKIFFDYENYHLRNFRLLQLNLSKIIDFF